MTNSRRKGCRGELEWAAWLKENLGIFARRGQQYSGCTEAPDVVHDLDEHLHFEVKRTETITVYKFLEQARRDAGYRVPVVAHKKNRGDWIIIMDADKMVEFARAIMLSPTFRAELMEELGGPISGT